MSPFLRRPISLHRLAREFGQLLERAGVSAQIALDPRIQLGSLRDYAATDLRTRWVYVAPRILRLRAPWRIGLLAHEVGHLILRKRPHTERQANRAAANCLGIRILYDRRNFPGRGVEYAS